MISESGGHDAGGAGLLLGFDEGGVNKKNSMKVNGSRTSRKTMPLKSTTTEKKRPMSLLKVISPETQGGHGDHDPIEAAEPGVLLVFPDHDGVEQHREKGDQQHQNDEETHEKTDIPTGRAGAEQDGNLDRNKLHEAAYFNQPRPTNKETWPFDGLGRGSI